MSRGLKRLAVLVVLVLIVVNASLVQAIAEFESRGEIRTGNVIYNSETTAIAILRAISHRETLARTDTETFAMSPLSGTDGKGLTIAQTSADTMVATQTGFIATLRYSWVPYDIGDKIGDSPEWAANVKPINIAGIPADSMMIFPSMTMIRRMPVDEAGNSSYIIDANASLPMYPGNLMSVENASVEQGTTAPGHTTGDFWTPYLPASEVANKTIIQRMWANAQIIYKLDDAYIGETCFPDHIWPVKSASIMIPMVPDDIVITGALNMTRDGMHMRKIFWPVG